MNTRSSVVLLFLTLSFLFIFQQSPSAAVPGIKAGPTQAVITDQSTSLTLKPDINFGNIPLYFTHNNGQVNKRALFYAKTPDYTLWVTKEGLVFDSIKKNEGESKKEKVKRKDILNLKATFRDVSRLLFVGANKEPEIVSLNPQKLKVNYFKGDDKSKWIGNVPTSGAVLYKNIYKNIDLKVYGIGKQIEYDWIVHSGGNPDDIKFEYKNVKKIKINNKGDLDIKTQFGKLTHKKPYAFQKSGEKIKSEVILSHRFASPLTKGGQGGSDSIANLEHRNEIKANFKKLSENTFGFTTGKYDTTKTLIIDPVVLAYSTYLGGGNYDVGLEIAVDNTGCVYVTGFTESTDFPTLNGYQSTYIEDYDTFITKIDTNASGALSLLYSSYLGGDNDDFGWGITIDANGIVYVGGETLSTDFPILHQFQGDQGGWDAFVTKIDTTQTGTSSLLYSTYLGGDSQDHGYGIAAGTAGGVYVTGNTYSENFPVIYGYQLSNNGERDIFVTKIDTTSGGLGLLYSTYLGGSSEDGSEGIAVDGSGYAYVAGYTSSSDFPTPDGYQTSFQGDCDAFIAKIDTTQSGASGLLYSTYLGGSDQDFFYEIAADNNENAYAAGSTWSSNFPTRNGYQTTLQGGVDAVVTKIDTTQNGISSLLYSTYLGGNDEDEALGICTDSNGNVYVTGNTSSSDFPIKNESQSYQDDDAFVSKIDTRKSGAGSLLYSTFLGGWVVEGGQGIAVDGNGFAYVAGYTSSSDFPTLNGYQITNQGFVDVFITRLSPYPLAIDYSVQVVTGNGGSVDKAKHLVMEGGSVMVNIYPGEGYEIDKIFDNGYEMTVSNPYIINDIQEDHTVEITFKRILYPPALSLTGVKKVEKAWIVQKGYSELKILITEHESPMVVSAYVLYKNVKGVWSEIKSYSGPGTYEYTDKFFGKDENVDYKLSAIAPDGSIIAETTLSL